MCLAGRIESGPVGYGRYPNHNDCLGVGNYCRCPGHDHDGAAHHLTYDDHHDH